MNKKGIIPLTIASALFFLILFLGLIFGVGFLFSGTLRWVIIGIAILIGFVYLVGQAMTSEFTRPKIIVLLIFLGVGVFFVLGSSVLQSVFSVSSVNVGPDGKVYWTVLASANNIDAGEVFTFNPTTYTKSDGSKITPKDPLVVAITKKQSFCSYQAEKVSKKVLILWNVDYYLLKPFERTAEVLITDGNGNMATLDATTISQTTISDKDGIGKITIETQGLLVGKTECPSGDNVVLYYKDNQFGIFDKTAWDIYWNNVNSFNPLSIYTTITNNIKTNTAFIGSFTKTPTFDGKELKGYRNIGNGAFTITADQDYFDSVIVTPPKQTKPIIDRINIPSQINKGSSSTMSVIIKNNEPGTSGTISVTAKSPVLSINPSSTNIGLIDIAIVDYTLSSSNEVGASSVVVTACSKDQFDVNKCDTETKSFVIIETDIKPKEFCGDKICQSSESATTCSIDCPVIIPPNNTNKQLCELKDKESPLMGWAWVDTSTEVGKGPFGIGSIIGLTKTITTEECKPQFLIYWVLGGIGAVLGSIVIILLFTTKKKKRVKNR